MGFKEDSNDPHFHIFTNVVESAIARYPKVARRDLNVTQKAQVEALVAAEKKLRRRLQSTPLGVRVYQSFIDYIRKERRNVLAARPFFRERDTTFKERISAALMSEVPRRLFPFHVNAVFINLMTNRMPEIKANPALAEMVDKVMTLRKGIIEQNLPLAISRARLFRRKTPASSHMENMDTVQTSAEGLLSAVDKYVLPWTPSFRAVIIGRSTGNMIATYSEPMLHFYPGDWRRLYALNKARRTTQELDKAIEIANTKLPQELRMSNDQAHTLMQASSHLSLNHTVDSVTSSTVQDLIADNNELPDSLVEAMDLHTKLDRGVSELTLLERKALVLRGLLSEENL